MSINANAMKAAAAVAVGNKLIKVAQEQKRQMSGPVTQAEIEEGRKRKAQGQNPVPPTHPSQKKRTFKFLQPGTQIAPKGDKLEGNTQAAGKIPRELVD